MSHDFNHILLGAMFNLKTHTQKDPGRGKEYSKSTGLWHTLYQGIKEIFKRNWTVQCKLVSRDSWPPLSFLKKTLEQTLPKIKDEIQDPDLLNQTEPARGVPCYFLGGYLMITKILFESHAILRFRVIDLETMNISGLAWDESNISLLCWVFH